MFGSPTSRKKEKRSSPVAARPTTMTLEELLDALRQLRSGTRFAGGETLRCSPWKAWDVQLLSRKFGVWREIWCWKRLLLRFLSAVYVDPSKVLHSCTCILHVCVNMMLSRIQRILPETNSKSFDNKPSQKESSFQNHQFSGAKYATRRIHVWYINLPTFTIKVNLSWRYIYHTQGG